MLAVVAATAAALIALASPAGAGTSGAAQGGEPVRCGPRRDTCSQQAGPEQVGPDEVGPEQVGPEQVRGEQVGPELADIVSRLRRAMRRAARAADPALGLSVAQLELLSCIAEHPGIRPRPARPDAPARRRARSATSLGGLQSAGYVTRTPGADNDSDRRTVSLDLSEEGAQAVSRWHRVNEDIIRKALAELPHSDRAALRNAAPALRDLTASIDAQAD